MSEQQMSWFGIFRLGLINAAMGAVIVLATSTLNRVMVVEWMLPATLPGLLVGLHYATQILRPRMGYASDLAGRRTPWIVGGMFVLALGGFLATLATAWMGSRPVAGFGLAAVGYVMIGLGAGAAGTALMALLSTQVGAALRPAAATVVWLMMIAGFVVTAGLVGFFLDPFSAHRLVVVSGTTLGIAFLLAWIAAVGLERSGSENDANTLAAAETVEEADDKVADKPPFREALRQIWSDRQARRFTIFIFISMLAYSGQNLILEPFAGIVFGFTPGQSTQLASLLYTGVLLGMVLVGAAASGVFGRSFGTLRSWTMIGCIASAIALLGLSAAGLSGPPWPLRVSVFVLGVANGAFAVSALGMMMSLASQGQAGREGTRMGLWGTAQAFAFGLGGLCGAAGVDLTRIATGSPVMAYALVFALQALLFACAARLIGVMDRPAAHDSALAVNPEREYLSSGRNKQ